MELLIRFLVFATLLAGCYSPSLDGKFECGTDGSCPPGLHCASDHVCRDTTENDGGGSGSVDLAMQTKTDMAMTCTKKTCSAQECGDALDGCGGKISCGTCPGMGAMKTCGAGGANMCGFGICAPTTCAAKGATCGLISDGCAAVLDCGSCSNGKSCGSNNQCS